MDEGGRIVTAGQRLQVVSQLDRMQLASRKVDKE